MKYWRILKETAIEFYNDDPMSYSASIAFYTLFSMPAIFIIVLTIAGSIYDDATARQNMLHQIQRLAGPDRAATAKHIMIQARGLGSSVIAKVVGIATLLFSATTVFGSLENALNNVWNIKPKPESNVWEFIRDRLLSLAMVASIGFLLLISLVADSLMVNLRHLINIDMSAATYYIAPAANLLLSIAIITVVFALIFKIIPDAKIHWGDVWHGALLTTILFTGGKYLISFYLSTSSIGDSYGTAGSLVIVLLWVYYSTLILLFGAEFTYVYSRTKGHKIKPDDQAVFIRRKEEQDGFINE